MWRYENVNSLDMQCRYLNAGLLWYSHGGLGSGLLGNYLHSHFGIRALEGLKIEDLIAHDIITPDLFVKFPEERLNEEAGIISKVHGSSPHTMSIPETAEEAAVHPFDYDGSIKHDYVDLHSCSHRGIKNYNLKDDNGIISCPYEAYFGYWNGYIVSEILRGGLFYADRLFSHKEALGRLKDSSDIVKKSWISIKPVFDRLSRYRTALSAATFGLGSSMLDEFDYASHLQELLGFGPFDLEDDLCKLLELYQRYDTGLYLDDNMVFKSKVVENLRSDIFYLVEWSSILTDRDYSYYFSEFSYGGRSRRIHASLDDVLTCEEDRIEKYLTDGIDRKTYTKDLSDSVELDDAGSIILRMKENPNWLPWATAYMDLHKRAERQGESEIEFTIPRVRGYMTIFVVLSELLIKDILGLSCKKLTLREVFKEIESQEKTSDVLSYVEKGLRKRVSSIKPGESFDEWEYAYPSDNIVGAHILRFIRARNYLAHTSHLDDKLTSSIYDLPLVFLKAALISVLYIDNFKQASWEGRVAQLGRAPDC